MARDDAKLVVEKRDAAWILGLHCEHDLATRDTLTAQINATPATTNLVIDLTQASFLDTTIISIIYAARQRLHQAGHVLAAVVPPASPVRHTIDLVALAAVIPIYDATDAPPRA